ncbi:MAG: molybdenum cofactor guanylyltransferase MobA [Pseudomonadota bacterium]
MKAPVGVVLAGGLSRRMGGGDKGLIELGGQSLLSHVIQRLAPQVADLALNANGDPTRFQGFGLPVVADSIPGHLGPLAGVLTGLEWARARNAGSVVTVAADTPFFPGDLVPCLLSAAEDQAADIAFCTTGQQGSDAVLHPTFGLWSVSLADDLRAALNAGVRKVVEFADRYSVAEAWFPATDFDPFFNVNTPEDLAHIRSTAGTRK